MSFFLLKQTLTGRTKERINFFEKIAQYWKGSSVTTSETNFVWDSIYKSKRTTIIVDNEIRLHKIKSGEDRHDIGR